MPADLESEMREMGARLLAEAPPVTTDEVIRYTADRRSSVTPIDPLITNVPALDDITEITSARRPSRRSVLIASVAAASMLAVGLGVATGLSDNADSTAVGTAPVTNAATTGPAPTTGVTAMPTSTAPVVGATISWPPRVLLDDSWEIIDANEKSINEGYVIFEQDGVSVYVGWYRGDMVGSPDKGTEGAAEAGTATLLGQSVLIYTPSPSYLVGDIKALIASGVLQSDRLESDFGLESADDSDLIGGELLEAELSQVIADGLIEGVATDGPFATLVQNAAALSVSVMPGDTNPAITPEELAALMPTLRQVEPSEWEAALPDNVVTPAERAAEVDEMMAGIPVPENFTVDFLSEQELVQSRGAIADEIVKSVACAWLTQYFTATDGNNPDAAQAALDAIGSIPDWPASQELGAAMDPDTAAGVIGIPNSGLTSLTVNADGTITNEGTGEVLTNDFAVNLCYVDAVG